jgi:hypothetical protein
MKARLVHNWRIGCPFKERARPGWYVAGAQAAQKKERR